MGFSLLGSRTFHRVRESTQRRFVPPAWVISLLAIFAVWESFSLSKLVPAEKLPPLHDVLLTLVQLGATPIFLSRVGQSFLNVATGISIALLVVLPLALLVGSRNDLDQALTPLIMLLGALPDLAILSLLVTVVGRGNAVAIAIAGFSAFFPTYFTIRQGVREIPADYFHVSSVFQASQFQTFTKVIMPSIFPNMVTGLRLSFEFSWNVLLAVEIIASVAGIGTFISSSLEGPGRSLTYGLAAIMTVGLLTVAMDRLFFEKLETRIRKWRA